MPAPEYEEDVEPVADAWPSRARQWCRACLALALVFGSLPLASKLIIGSWGFDDAPGIACLLLAATAYLHFAGRVRRPIPDSATLLGDAIQAAAAGNTARGIALLNRALRLSPDLWQAREYRGQMRLGESAAAESALQDFTDAIALAPAEAHLYILRSHVYHLLGRDPEARADWETAGRLGADTGSSAPNENQLS